MKKFLAYLLVTLVGLSSMSSAFAVTNTSTSNISYRVTVQNIVNKYVDTLDNSGYTDTEIISRLEKLRGEYAKQKSLSTYRGTRKIKINTIIDAINDKINEIKNREGNDDDLYNLLNQATTNTTTNTTVTNNYYTTPPVANAPTTNNITGVNSVLINGVIKTTFVPQNPANFYKNYDVYLYTPSNTNNWPQARTFIAKPDYLLYNYYNSYTITTNFQSETNTDTVKAIRLAAENSSYISKRVKSGSSQDVFFEIFGPLTDREFSERAKVTQVATNTSYYETYFLYIAKDNSEAFTLRFGQSGNKKVSGKYLNGIDFSSIYLGSGFMSTKMSVNTSFYKSYSSYSFTPGANSSPSKDFMDAGMHTVLGKFQYINTSQNNFYANNKQYTYWVNNYCSSNSSDVTTMANYFAQKVPKTTNTNVANINVPFTPLKQPQNLEGSYRYYLYLTADDGSEGCLAEYVGLQTGL